MTRFHRPFLALLISVLLLAAQQAAFTHALGHLRAGSAGETRCRQDDGATDRPAEACATCVAFAAIGGNAPPAHADTHFGTPHRDCPVAMAAFWLPTQRVGTYHARAPPTLL